MNAVEQRVWETGRRGTRKLLLLALARYADPLGICWPSIPTLAALIGEATHYTSRIARDAEEEGDIFRHPGQGRGVPTVYGVACGLSDIERGQLAVIVQHTVVARNVRYLELDGERIKYEPGAEQILFQAATIDLDTDPEPEQKRGTVVPLLVQVENPVRNLKNTARSQIHRPARRPLPEPEHIRWLREEEGITSAANFAHLDAEALILDYRNRRAEGQPKGAIVKYWQQYPPTRENYYRGQTATNTPERPARSARPGDQDYYN